MHLLPEWPIVRAEFNADEELQYRTLDELCAGLTGGKKKPLAVVFCEDGSFLTDTIARLRAQGFEDIALVDATLSEHQDEAHSSVHRVNLLFRGDAEVAAILDLIIETNPGRWIFWCYDGEFLFFPHCETRSIADVVTFMEEERRDSVASTVVDLFSDGFLDKAAEDPRQSACLDTSGYFGLQRFDGPEPLERQYDVVGGLKWRFEEHIPWVQRRVDRVSLFRAVPGLEMDAHGLFNDPEYNTISCPWHNNLTIAIASFRTARGLVHNPGSRAEITSLMSPQSAPFEWNSQQLLELGFMEPGQWF